MGKSSGGVNGYSGAGATAVGVNSNGKRITAAQAKAIKSSVGPISSLEHREVVRQLQQGITRYEAVMGLRERSIKVANISGAYGVTFISRDGSQGIYLSRQVFNQKRDRIEADYRKANYDTGFKNRTNKPIQHTITHELAHATWTSSYSSPKHQAAGKEIRSLYREWARDKRKKGYGTYGKTNVDEFWAEVVTKAVHGSADRYTKRAKGIAKKYKL